MRASRHIVGRRQMTAEQSLDPEKSRHMHARSNEAVEIGTNTPFRNPPR